MKPLQPLAATLPLPGIVQDVLRFRTFIGGSVRREIESQYKASLLGAAWIFLQPLAMIAIYTLIFANRRADLRNFFGDKLFRCPIAFCAADVKEKIPQNFLSQRRV